MTPHARAFGLPGWPCPPRVRDIPNHQDSWGFIRVSTEPGNLTVAVDDLGYLWANGDTVPKFRVPVDSHSIPGALVCWTPDGLGLWVHPKSMEYLPSISRLDMQADQWVPIAVALADPPPQARQAGE